MRVFFAVAVAWLTGLTPVQAPAQAKDTHIGQFGAWDAFSATVAGRKACWVASKPTKTEPRGIRRDPPSLLVSWWPGQKVRGQVKLNAGFPFRKDSEVTLRLGNTTFALWTKGETAWADDAAHDRRIVAALKGGRTVTVEGTSTRGTRVVDTYSLDGISAAISAARDACR